MGDVTCVLISCGRPDLLAVTLESFFRFNAYPIERFIIVEDSGIQGINDDLKKQYPKIDWIDNEKNEGQIASVIKGYAKVKTKYIFHMEDDWQFLKTGFIEASIPVLEQEEKCLQVWIRGRADTNGHPLAGLFRIGQNIYGKMKRGHLGIWHGFSFNCGLRRMADYVPYNQITKFKGQSNSGAEQEIGQYYHDKDYFAATTINRYVNHIGYANSTRKKQSIWSLDDARQQHAHSPKLADKLKEIISKKKPVIDLGCGLGKYLQTLKDDGFKCFGFEGTEGIEDISFFKPIAQADLSKPLETDLKGTVICLEVAEHIPQQYESILIDNIVKANDDLLILSWAVKGQGGHGHFNEQNEDYVVPLFQSRGYTYNAELSKELRKLAGSDLWWFKKTIYIFNLK